MEISTLENKLYELEEFIDKKGININIENSGENITISLLNKENNTTIAHVVSGVGEFRIRLSPLKKHDEPQEIETFYISWISIDNELYIKKGLGAFLLLYCLIYLINFNNAIKWVTLDDDIDNSTKIKTFYDRFGFEPVDLVYLKSNGKNVKLSGPEKQLNIEKHFLPRLDYLLTNVKRKVDEKLVNVTSGGLKKRSKSKKSKKSKKSRKTRKIKKRN